MGILSIDIKNINLEDPNYNENDPEINIHVRLSAWHIRCEKNKALKMTS